MITPYQRQRASDQLDKVTPALSAEDASTELAITTQSEKPMSNQTYNDVCSISGDGLISINKEGKISFINKIACKLTDWTQAEAKNQSIEKIFQLNENSTLALSQSLISDVIESGQLIAPLVEQEIRTKDNEILIINFSISPLNRDSAVLMFHQFKQQNDQQAPPFTLSGKL